MTGNPNAALVHRLFSAWAAGDAQTAVDLLSPTLRYYGYDQTGEPREFRDRDDFFEMVGRAAAQTDEFTTRIVHAFPVGDSLVVVHARAHRRAAASQETVDDDFIIAYRIENGRITHGIDLCGPALIDFWKRTSGA